jgi:hypothetical protein
MYIVQSLVIDFLALLVYGNDRQILLNIYVRFKDIGRYLICIADQKIIFSVLTKPEFTGIT